MQHTYLRYECADAFSLSTSAGATSVSTTRPLGFLPSTVASGSNMLLSISGSQIIGFNLRTNEPSLKIAHREVLSGGLGTGKALNSNQVLVMAVSSEQTGAKIATGWKDGSVRIFDVTSQDFLNHSKPGLVHSLLFQNLATQEQEDFITREPLLLNGHSGSPITSLAFDAQENATILATGSSDGVIILWDILNGTLVIL